jgi:cbb3-type cytochrome oxidase subunit 1
LEHRRFYDDRGVCRQAGAVRLRQQNNIRIATAFWGVVGFLVGVFIAFQLAFPVLNFEWAQGY